MNKIKLTISLLFCCIALCACSSAPAASQTRKDLTEEHFRGLAADMKRNDVEDLIGQSDSALKQNESFEMYSLADGTTAILRYAGEKLQAAYIRGKDNMEKTLFSNYEENSSNEINDGTTGETDHGLTGNDNTTGNANGENGNTNNSVGESNFTDNITNENGNNNNANGENNTNENTAGENNNMGNTTGGNNNLEENTNGTGNTGSSNILNNSQLENK